MHLFSHLVFSYNYNFHESSAILDKIFIIPPLNEVERGVYWNEIVRLSVCTPQSPLTLSRVQFFSDRGQTW